MIINHNMNALNAHRMMTSNTVASGKSMEKLSSGLRINRAGDDAAGLAISEKMRGQIRGLDQASRNSQDGISLIQTAEGALNETHSILQRMRELAVQAGNDTYTGEDRDQIQNEINQLTSEINRIANTTEFNKQKVLNGGNVEGAGEGEASKAVAGKFEFTLSTLTNDDTVVIDGETFTKKAGDNAAGGEFKDAAGLKAAIEANDKLKDKYTVEVDGDKFTLTQKEGQESDTALKLEVTGTKKAEMEGTFKTVTEGKAAEGAKGGSEAKEAKEATAATVTGKTIAGADLTGKDATLKITIDGTEYEVAGADLKKDIADKDAALAALKAAKDADGNSITDKADIKLDGEKLVITSKSTGESSNIKVAIGGTDADDVKGVFGLDAEEAKGTDKVEGGEESDEGGFKATLQVGANKGQAFEITIGDMSSSALGISEEVGEADGADGAEEGSEAKEATAATVTGKTIAGADLTGKDATLKITIDGTEYEVAGADLKKDIADKDAALAALKAAKDADGNSITDKADIKLDGEKLVITSKSTGESSNIKVAIGGTDADDVKGVFGLDAEEAKGTDKVEAKEGGEGGTFTDKATVTNGTDSKNIESALDVSNHENATNAIETINEAITKVSTQRSKLGAFQNRLEHTINNLGTASENLTAAESRIRDVDMAKEMLAFSKKNILQQASQAMLAQAKQAPQGVLQLLR